MNSDAEVWAYINELVATECARRAAIEDALVMEALSDPDAIMHRLHIVHQDGQDPSIASWWSPR